MIDKKKQKMVIMGLECRLNINSSKYKNCLSCDYRHDLDHCQWACQVDGVLEDALSLLRELIAFKEYFDDLYGTGLEVANWHMNGALEPFDSFYDSVIEAGECNGTI